ncbi:hypothetical protein O0I10_001340 [Lichtheimia ornata]|uniref:NodB homology domain-containing protein n=1 Tax=Lichtheimia ornata TaxID=688661 RepID=A0AAD7Y3L0_9FUNG|nr:uncharacterized protein O0I10_001340 [Lichtheimia ornata]KAJ8663163.1 hypothetical protein O0I10_001340 [Lichtheimia ornata]
MAILSRLFLIATLALATSAQFTETYPEDGVVPTPKKEWMDIIAKANISKAPIRKSNGDDGPQPSGGEDEFCWWTNDLCMRDNDISTCPDGKWGLTYDDGPTEFSPALYDFLDQKKQKATFFMIGGQVVKFRDHAKRAFDAGHELAGHTWSHSYLTTLTNEQIVGELMWTARAIEEVTGKKPRYFRPPYGDIDDRVRDIASALGFTAVIWDHDTDDWRMNEEAGFKAEWIAGNATEWAANSKSGISLEHDLYKETVDAAIKIYPTLKGAFDVQPVGVCTGQNPYQGGNDTTTPPAASSAAASSSAVASSSSAVASGTSPASSGANPTSSSESDASKDSSKDGKEADTEEGSASRMAAASAGLVLTAALSYIIA